MKHSIHHVYRSTLKKYSKFKLRLEKNIASGRFYSFSQKKKREVIQRIKRLKKRLENLELQLKIAVATGSLALGLSTTSQAQQLGPFVENIEMNPLRGTEISGPHQIVAFADLDEDGDQDVLIGDSSGALKYYENIGSSTTPILIERTTATDNPFDGISEAQNSAPVLADFDGDGDADLILGYFDGYLDDGISYYENDDFDDDGVIGNSPTFNDRSGVNGPIQGVEGTKYNIKPELVDIDNDGDLDIFIGQDDGYPYDGNILFYENDAGFSGRSALPTGLEEFASTFTGLSYVSPTFSDVDSDGDFDLFVGTSGGTVRYFENRDDTDGTIGNNPNFAEIIGSQNPLDGVDVGTLATLTFVDFDGDGDNDIAIGNGYTSEPPNYFENTGSGFIERTGLNNPFGALDVGFDASPTFVDIDDDGDLDAIIGSKYRDDVFFLENNEGTFTDLTGTGTPFDGLSADPNAASSPAFALLDNDADFDLILGFYYDPAVTFYRNTGTTNSPSLSNEGDPFNISVVSGSDSSPTLGDVTGDGVIDAIVGFDNQGGLRFFEGTSNAPEFVERTGTLNPFNALAFGTVGESRFAKPDLVDLDFDGDLDLAVGIHGYSAETYDGAILYLENDGNNNFNQLTGSLNPFDGILAGTLTAEKGDSEPTFVDIDVDGDLDLFVGNADGQVQYFENQNQAPVVVSNITSLTFTNGDPPLVFDFLSISDDTDDDLLSLQVIISEGFQPTEDLLSVTTGNTNLVSSFDQQSGILTISGSASISDYQQVVQSLEYSNTASSPVSSTRTLTFIPTDFDNTNPLLDNTPETVIQITVLNVSAELNIYNAISPNGDNLNDWWILEGISAPNNIKIYNRWGDEVKSLTDYIGSPDIPNTELDDLIVGTYFYEIESPEGSFTGYLTVKK